MNALKKKLILGLSVSALTLTACTPPPPPVTKTQLTTAESDALQAEDTAKKLQSDKADLEKKVQDKQTEIQKMKEQTGNN